MVHQSRFPSLSENGTRVSTKKYSTPKTKVLSARDKLLAAKEMVKKNLSKAHSSTHRERGGRLLQTIHECDRFLTSCASDLLVHEPN